MGAQAVGGILQGMGDTQQAVAAGMQVGAQRKAAKAAAKQTQQAIDYNKAFADQERERQLGLQQPYMTAGQGALGDLESFRMREADPYQAQQFGGVDMSQDPGVQYRMQQAQQGLDASAGAQGQLFSGAHQKALMEQQQNLASQEFGNAYGRQYGQFAQEEQARQQQANVEANRMMNYDQYRMGQLGNMAGMGQQGATTYGGQAAGIGQQQLGNEMMLRGHMADSQGVIAGGPMATAAAVNMTLGKGASGYGKQMGGMGMFGGGGGGATSAGQNAATQNYKFGAK